jgi:transposase
VQNESPTTSNQQSATRERRGPVLDRLRELLAEGRTDDALAVVRRLVTRNAELERRLAQLLARGRKSEGVSSAQLRLLLDGLGAEGDEELQEADQKLRTVTAPEPKAKEGEERATERPRRQPPRRRPFPPNLRRLDNPIPVPEAERPCPRCGGERKCCGHEVSEVLELIPAELVIRCDRREQLACENCAGELTRAPMGEKVVAGGRFGARLVAEFVVDKYRDGIPLHREKQRFERLGCSLSVSTLGDQITWVMELLLPLWRAALVLRAKVMHLDATSLLVLDHDVAGGKRIGALWGYVGDRDLAVVIYASTAKKAGQLPGEIGPEDMLRLRKGYTVAEASSLFDASFKTQPDVIECGCNMHARRYLVKALDSGDTRAALPLAAFKKIYDIEDEVRGLDAEAVRAVQQAKTRPVYQELVSWCETHKPHEPPSSPMGAAIRYLTNHQVALQRLLEDGSIPPDNGIVERLHVRTALTRKNFLFAGSDAGGQRAAVAYTILACCQLSEVNPVEYLADVLPRLMQPIRLRDVPDLLPDPWKTLRQATPQA